MKGIHNAISARSNTTQRKRPIIGFIIPEVGTQVNSQIWAGAVDAARARDVNLIGFSGYELQRPDAFKAQGNILYDLISVDNVDGLVLWTNSLSNYTDPETARKLYERFPVVPMVELEVTPATVTENYSYRAMGAVVRHLIETHECYKIAFIRGPAGHQEAEYRYRAFLDVVQMEQLPADPERVVLADDWFEPSGKKAIEILLDQRHATFDAIVAANDLLAMGALQELQNRGIRVPNDVAVAGFDDIIDAQYCTPPLTTVRYPLYEMGWQAIEALALEISGQIFERNPFPVQLRIRYSCGCLSRTVLQTAAGETAVLDGPFEAAFAARREVLLTEMWQMSEEAGATSEWTERLVDAFASEIRGNIQGEFIALLNNVLDQTFKAGGDMAKWQGVISVLYHQLLPCLEDRRSIGRAEDLWQQARVLIGEVTTRAKMSQALEKEQQSRMLFEIADCLVTTFNVKQLMDVLAKELPRLQIPSCYLSLYEDPQAPTEWARLILAYNEQGRVALEDTGQRFPAKHLVPDLFLPQDRQYTMLLKDLYFHEQQIGFVLFEVSSRGKNVYETLCGLISSALQGAQLVQQVYEHANELAAAYEEISILNNQLQEENVRMSAELNVARRLQEMILPPPEELQQIEGIDIVGYMQPADEVGGDYYDVLKENGMIHIGIGDVTGHGLESGVLMLMTQTAIRTLIEHGETDPVAFVNTLNRTIYKDIRRMGADKTLTFALIEYQTGHVKIVGQHEEMLVVRKDGKLERMDTMDLGFPIGLEEEIAQWVASATVSLQPGDGMVLYTDGITEAENMEKELYGLERLCDVVNRHWSKSAEGIKQSVIEDVMHHIGQQKVYDDLTLVVIKQQ